MVCCRDIIRSRLVPKAVSWYTGEEADDDSDEEYGDEEDDEDEDDDDDEVWPAASSALEGHCMQPVCRECATALRDDGVLNDCLPSLMTIKERAVYCGRGSALPMHLDSTSSEHQ